MAPIDSVEDAVKALCEADSSILAGALSDVVILVDRQGLVQDIAVTKSLPDYALAESWRGAALLDKVTVESTSKLNDLLAKPGSERARQVNHNRRAPGGNGAAHPPPSWPVSYISFAVPDSDKILLVGQDLSAASELQQQLLRLQSSKEQDYARLRGMESRYRVIFETGADAILIVDAASLRVAEVNGQAAKLFKGTHKKLIGRTIVDLAVTDDAGKLVDKVSAARATGTQQNLSMRLRPGDIDHAVSISPFREDDKSVFLVRVAPSLTSNAHNHAGNGSYALPQLIERAPDAFIVTDLNGNVVSANQAFLAMADLTTPEQAIGHSLEQWLGRPGIDFDLLLNQLRSQGQVRLYATSLRGNYGSMVDVEVAAGTEMASGNTHYAFMIRDVQSRVPDEHGLTNLLPHSSGQLTELIGRVPLKELVRQATDVIERLCIESALELTEENRASAAEILGLSRQGFYMKLRRYGMIDSSAKDLGD